MVARHKLNGEKKKPRNKPGDFQKGNTLGYGNRGHLAKPTNRLLTRAAFRELMLIEDPKTQRTKADKLVRAVLKRGIEEGDVQVLKAFWERLEGSPLQQVAFKDFTDQPKLITKDMTPQEAALIMQGMLRRPGEAIDLEDLEEANNPVSETTPYWRSTREDEKERANGKGLEREKQPLEQDEHDEKSVRKSLHVSPYERALNHPKMRERRR
jgi:hypothetical protein